MIYKNLSIIIIFHSNGSRFSMNKVLLWKKNPSAKECGRKNDLSDANNKSIRLNSFVLNKSPKEENKRTIPLTIILKRTLEINLILNFSHIRVFSESLRVSFSNYLLLFYYYFDALYKLVNSLTLMKNYRIYPICIKLRYP